MSIGNATPKIIATAWKRFAGFGRTCSEGVRYFVEAIRQDVRGGATRSRIGRGMDAAPNTRDRPRSTRRRRRGIDRGDRGRATRNRPWRSAKHTRRDGPGVHSRTSLPVGLRTKVRRRAAGRRLQKSMADCAREGWPAGAKPHCRHPCRAEANASRATALQWVLGGSSHLDTLSRFRHAPWTPASLR